MVILTCKRIAEKVTTSPRQTPVWIQLTMCKTSRGFSKLGMTPGGGVAAGTNVDVDVGVGVGVDVDTDAAAPTAAVAIAQVASSSRMISLSSAQYWQCLAFLKL